MTHEVAPSQTDAIARGLELVAGAESGESFVRTFTYNSGRRMACCSMPRLAAGRGGRAAATIRQPLLMRALGVQLAADAAAAAARYGGAELRAAEERREQQRQARIAGLHQPFVAISGDGWTFRAAAGTVVRAKARAGAITKPCASSRECELKRSIE